MKAGKLCRWPIILAAILVAVSGTALGAPSGPDGSMGSDGIESLHFSNVYWDWNSGDKCPLRNTSQTFCFIATSYTDDWDYVFYLWMRFPADWTINDVYVQGAPYCDNGGTFESFSWSPVAANEVRIDHQRYHANPSDICFATYCFEVVSGSLTPGWAHAFVSWYWTGSGYGDPPYYPCSNDGYTPPGQPACDEMVEFPAAIPRCWRVYLPMALRGH
jgi:hypothetical protein